MPGDICSPARRTEAPSKRISSSEMIATETTASRARKRRSPCWSKRLIRLSSVERVISEAEVDERGHALARHGGADERHQDGEADGQQRRLHALEAHLEALHAARGQQLQ